MILKLIIIYGKMDYTSGSLPDEARKIAYYIEQRGIWKMATRREPRFKLCRRLNVNVYGHPKAMKRVRKDTRGSKKVSEYGMRLMEKQKLKAYYGLFEKQLVRYVKKAMAAKEPTGIALLQALECRLDNLVYRIGFGNSIRQSRQMVSHGHISVNGRRVNILSYHVKTGDVISLQEKYRKNAMFASNFLDLKSFSAPYLRKDFDAFSGTLERLPAREEIPVEVNDIHIIEFYSK